MGSLTNLEVGGGGFVQISLFLEDEIVIPALSTEIWAGVTRPVFLPSIHTTAPAGSVLTETVADSSPSCTLMMARLPESTSMVRVSAA